MRLHAYPKLTKRQEQVYDMLITESDMQDIADALELTERGVKFHINSIFAKTKCHRRWHLIARHYKLSKEMHHENHYA